MVYTFLPKCPGRNLEWFQSRIGKRLLFTHNVIDSDFFHFNALMDGIIIDDAHLFTFMTWEYYKRTGRIITFFDTRDERYEFEVNQAA